ncbi:MAG: hypothetical protein ABTQ32_05760 [Myxococcaceae bacterium]
MRLALVLTLLTSCAPAPTGIDFVTTDVTAPLVQASLEFVPDPRVTTQRSSAPRTAAGRASVTVAVVERSDCTDCYRIDRDGSRLVISGGLPLGVQYGVAHVLELHGYRFHHPWKTYVPPDFLPIDPAAYGQEHAPEVDVRRGLHLHTLHPIEALYDFWVPSAKNLEGARRTIDFVVKNRGNFVSMYALDDITNDDEKTRAWRAHTKQILAYATSRGVDLGIAIQLFGKANLQLSFDLIDDETSPNALAELERRLHVLLDETPYASVQVAFGEFFKADPAQLVQKVDETYAALQRVRPGVEMVCSVHVGNFPDLRVDYMGVRQLYYFLIRYANPAIVPWVHTVFFYNLYDDAGGAYLHDDFSEHRAFLEERVRTGKPVAYYPESAYWIAFDNSVPTYLPLYMKSRHLDLARLKDAGRLRQHVLFSTGWEWGYWQTDVATLRMTYELPSTWSDPVREQFAPFAEKGLAAADLVRRLGDAQYDGLLTKRLAAYLASRDEVIEVGKARGIVSQPDRVLFGDLRAMTPSERAAFVTRVLDPLEQLAARQTELDDALVALGLPLDNPWLAELSDGFAITAGRSRFIHALYRAVAVSSEGGDAAALLKSAEDELAKAETVVRRRRNALWDPDAIEVLRNNDNPTFYDYGYLREADTLCFWKRERAQVRNLLLGEGLFIPACVL